MTAIYRSESKSATHPSKSKSTRRDITGRDGYIIAKSLYRYVATEGAKASKDQAWSDLQDARAILLAYFPGTIFGHDCPGSEVSLIDEKAPRDQLE
jgi:hypothetical protein